MIELLQGYKTHLLVLIALLVLICRAYGIIDNDITWMLLGALGFGTMSTIHAAISRNK